MRFRPFSFFFFFNDTATTEIYTLSLHDALPIYMAAQNWKGKRVVIIGAARQGLALARYLARNGAQVMLNDRRKSERSEEHTSELQSRQYLVCRLLLEKKKKQNKEVKCTVLLCPG